MGIFGFVYFDLFLTFCCVKNFSRIALASGLFLLYWRLCTTPQVFSFNIFIMYKLRLNAWYTHVLTTVNITLTCGRASSKIHIYYLSHPFTPSPREDEFEHFVIRGDQSQLK